jgi:hypothetical protein
MVAGIAKQRKMTEAEVYNIANNALVTNAPAAKQYNLVDDL